MALDIFSLQMTSKHNESIKAVAKETPRDTISALWAEYKREKADTLLAHMIQPNYPLPQEGVELPPQVEAQLHRHQPKAAVAVASEKNHDFELISRQMSASSDEGCPVVISREKTHSEVEQEKLVREQRRGSRWWEKAMPSGVTEELVHMAFTVS